MSEILTITLICSFAILIAAWTISMVAWTLCWRRYIQLSETVQHLVECLNEVLRLLEFSADETRHSPQTCEDEEEICVFMVPEVGLQEQ